MRFLGIRLGLPGRLPCAQPYSAHGRCIDCACSFLDPAAALDSPPRLLPAAAAAAQRRPTEAVPWPRCSRGALPAQVRHAKTPQLLATATRVPPAAAALTAAAAGSSAGAESAAGAGAAPKAPPAPRSREEEEAVAEAVRQKLQARTCGLHARVYLPASA